MSLMDKIKEFFSGGSAGEAGEHDHTGHDHSGHTHESSAATAPVPAPDPTGLSEPSPAPGSVSMPEPMQPGESERRDDL